MGSKTDNVFSREMPLAERFGRLFNRGLTCAEAYVPLQDGTNDAMAWVKASEGTAVALAMHHVLDKAAGMLDCLQNIKVTNETTSRAFIEDMATVVEQEMYTIYFG